MNNGWESMNIEEIGSAFVTLVVISRALGHTDIKCTARDYLAPHPVERTPEWQFVLDAVLKAPDELIPDDLLPKLLACYDLPPLEAPR